MSTFAWNAADYAVNSSAQQLWASELIDKLGLDGAERILDLGCGDGKVTAELAARVPNGSVLGVDKSADMVALASQTHAGRHPRMAFCVCDARELDFDSEFDVVFSNAVLHWVPEHDEVLRRIARALVPGGRILMQMGGRGCADVVVRAWQDIMKRPRWRSYFREFSFAYAFYGPDQYFPWLEAAGLRARRVELIPKDMVHTPQKFEAWIRTTWLGYTHCVPEAQREDAIDEVVERYIELCPLDGGGLVHVAMIRLEVEAEKPL